MVGLVPSAPAGPVIAESSTRFCHAPSDCRHCRYSPSCCNSTDSPSAPLMFTLCGLASPLSFVHEITPSALTAGVNVAPSYTPLSAFCTICATASSRFCSASTRSDSACTRKLSASDTFSPSCANESICCKISSIDGTTSPGSMYCPGIDSRTVKKASQIDTTLSDFNIFMMPRSNPAIA